MKETWLPLKISYSHARDHLAEVWDEVEDSREAAVIQRRGRDDMALIPAEELASLRETAHLLGSPQNASRLLSALRRARRGGTPPQDLSRLREDLGRGKTARAKVGIVPNKRGGRRSRSS